MITKENKNLVYLKTNIFESIKDCSSHTNIIVPHVCNNVNGFGAGFAGDVSEHYPEVKINFHMLGNKNKLGHVQYISVYKNAKYDNKIIFANMIAQNGIMSKSNPRPLNYIALAYCLSDVARYIQNYKKQDLSRKIEIHAPKFGSGLAGGDWNHVKSMLEDAWKPYTTYIYLKQ
jgi:hypothetical protein